MPFTWNAAQFVGASILKLDARASNEILDRAGYEDLSGFGLSGARAPV